MSSYIYGISIEVGYFLEAPSDDQTWSLMSLPFGCDFNGTMSASSLIEIVNVHTAEHDWY